jgi:hypothetical protein
MVPPRDALVLVDDQAMEGPDQIAVGLSRALGSWSSAVRSWSGGRDLTITLRHGNIAKEPLVFYWFKPAIHTSARTLQSSPGFFELAPNLFSFYIRSLF